MSSPQDPLAAAALASGLFPPGGPVPAPGLMGLRDPLMSMAFQQQFMPLGMPPIGPQLMGMLPQSQQAAAGGTRRHSQDGQRAQQGIVQADAQQQQLQSQLPFSTSLNPGLPVASANATTHPPGSSTLAPTSQTTHTRGPTDAGAQSAQPSASTGLRPNSAVPGAAPTPQQPLSSTTNAPMPRQPAAASSAAEGTHLSLVSRGPHVPLANTDPEMSEALLGLPVQPAQLARAKREGLPCCWVCCAVWPAGRWGDLAVHNLHPKHLQVGFDLVIGFTIITLQTNALVCKTASNNHAVVLGMNCRCCMVCVTC